MARDIFTSKWIIDNSVEIISNYNKGELTLRALHYQLVGLGMTNSIQHYKRVVKAMESARWSGLVTFDTFSDLDRVMIGSTDYETTTVEDSTDAAKSAIILWMNYYSKNRWENQIYYPEVFIEKKALQSVFQNVCSNNDVTLGACKGYPSLTFLYEATQRFNSAVRSGKTPIILYFGDYDPTGEDIPRSIEANIKRMGCEEIQLKRFALFEEQVLEWKLPPAPTKDTDTRSKNWDGLGQVELDAVKPSKLRQMCQDTIDSIFDKELYKQLKEQEAVEEEMYKQELREYVRSL